MSEADKMFKELGYEEFFKNSIDIGYSNESNVTIHFYGAVETFEKYPYPINMQELKAINKKVEELGWNWDISEFIDSKIQKRIEEGGSVFPID